MARVNVIIPDDLLDAVNKMSAEKDISRSRLLQEAIRRYLEDCRLAREAAERKQRMQKAAARMDRLAEQFGRWDGVGTIRRFRDRRDGKTR